jgi:hypothetical protein
MSYLLGLGAFYFITLTLLSIGVHASPLYYGEAGSFIQLINKMAVTGNLPFRQFEFMYGPILLYFPLAVGRILAPFGISLEVSYYASVMAMMLIGLLLLYWILNWLELGARTKRFVFVFTGIGMLNVTLGENYTPVRFLIAPALLLLQSELDSRSKLLKPISRGSLITLYICFGSCLAWSISPEAGVAYSASSAVYCTLSAWRNGLSALFGLIAAPAGIALMWTLFGPDYLTGLLSFAGGFGNFPIIPAPHILLFLLTLTLIVPAGLARMLRWNGSRNEMLYASLAVLGLSYSAPALGRCDPGHVLFNGIVILFLGFVMVERYWKRWMPYYLAAFGLIFALGVHLSVEYSYRGQIKPVLFYAAKRYPAAASLKDFGDRTARLLNKPFTIADQEKYDLLALEKVGRVVTPIQSDKRIDEYLRAHNKFVSEPYVGLIGVSDEKSMKRKLDVLKREQWVLVDLTNCCSETDTPAFTEELMMCPFPYRRKNEPQIPEADVRSYILSHFTRIADVGPYSLYQKRL